MILISIAFSLGPLDAYLEYNATSILLHNLWKFLSVPQWLCLWRVTIFGGMLSLLFRAGKTFGLNEETTFWFLSFPKEIRSVGLILIYDAYDRACSTYIFSHICSKQKRRCTYSRFQISSIYALNPS